MATSRNRLPTRRVPQAFNTNTMRCKRGDVQTHNGPARCTSHLIPPLHISRQRQRFTKENDKLSTVWTPTPPMLDISHSPGAYPRPRTSMVSMACSRIPECWYRKYAQEISRQSDRRPSVTEYAVNPPLPKYGPTMIHDLFDDRPFQTNPEVMYLLRI